MFLWVVLFGKCFGNFSLQEHLCGTFYAPYVNVHSFNHSFKFMHLQHMGAYFPLDLKDWTLSPPPWHWREGGEGGLRGGWGAWGIGVRGVGGGVGWGRWGRGRWLSKARFKLTTSKPTSVLCSTESQNVLTRLSHMLQPEHHDHTFFSSLPLFVSLCLLYYTFVECLPIFVVLLLTCHPVVTLCGWQDIKIHSQNFCISQFWQLFRKSKKKIFFNFFF